ncbi:amidohydrolase family protein [Streptomyces sp. NK08204]|uniref:amidohydrolase family protein n=1 Tax=Streptomyces sp. NK08204 TaxID=2873260 RepID=UPI0035A87DE3
MGSVRRGGLPLPWSPSWRAGRRTRASLTGCQRGVQEAASAHAVRTGAAAASGARTRPPARAHREGEADPARGGDGTDADGVGAQGGGGDARPERRRADRVAPRPHRNGGCRAPPHRPSAPARHRPSAPARHRPSAPAPHGPEQGLTALQSLQGVTVDTAWAAGEENSAGRSAVGRRADLTALADHPLRAPDTALAARPLLLTAVTGRATAPARGPAPPVRPIRLRARRARRTRRREVTREDRVARAEWTCRR